jgi:hypothetical protein
MDSTNEQRREGENKRKKREERYGKKEGRIETEAERKLTEKKGIQ